MDPISCALGQLVNYNKQHGGTVDEAALQRELKDPHAKAVYANGSGKYYSKLGLDAPVTDKAWAKGMDFLSDRKDILGELHAYVASSDGILGKDLIDRVEKVYLDHIKRVKEAGIKMDESKYLWDEKAQPEMQKLYYDAFNKLRETAPQKLQYLDDVMLEHVDGTQIFGSFRHRSAIGKLASNLMTNFIGWNPALVAYHALEGLPKMMAYAVENGGSPADVILAMRDHIKANNGNPFGRAKDMTDQGLFGVHEEGEGFHGIHRLVDVSENFLRGTAYRLGERLGKGGTHGMEKVAFVYRYGNAPLLALKASGFTDLGLMRYAIGQGKFYLHMFSQPKNPRMMAALAAFSVMNAIQTGFKSIIPLPAQALLPDDVKQAIQELSDATPGVNLIQKMLGTDLSEKASPGAFPGIGVPLAMVNQTIKGAGGFVKKGVSAFEEGRPTEGALRIVQALWGIGQLDNIPGVNIATQKALAAVADQVAGENDNAAIDFAKKTHIYVEPEE